MKRMYGDFQMGPEYGPGPGGGRKAKRDTEKTKPGVPDVHADPSLDPASHLEFGESYFSKLRRPRQSFRNNQSTENGR